jgi:hypothetical protein
MASTYKVLGQLRPADSNVADLYTVPAGAQAVVSTIAITNTTGVASTCDIYVRPDGTDAAAVGNAIVYGTSVGANSTVTMTVGITVDSTDVISVKSGTADAITFTAFGLEIS